MQQVIDEVFQRMQEARKYSAPFIFEINLPWMI